MTSTKKFLLLLLLTFCSLALRCASTAKLESNTIDQGNIYQQYSVRRTPESLEIRALFRVHDRNGDTLTLSSPSQVTYNDKAMPRRDGFMLGVTYVADEQTYHASNKFAFTDTNGKTFTNTVNLEPLEIAGTAPPSFVIVGDGAIVGPNQ